MEDIAKQNKQLYIKIGALICVVIFIIIAYSKGYRLQSNFLIGKVGVVSINLPIIQTSVFVDEKKSIETTKDNQDVKITLSPRTHNIIISHVGYFPWTKKITMKSKGTVELHPMFVSINASGEIITMHDPEYWTIKSKIVHGILPTKDSPIISFDKSSKLWMEDNAIIVNAASTTRVVIQPDTVIKNVAFYKNRSDVVVFSTQSGVYAIEVDKENTQNFMPIYKGTNPYFMSGNEGFIYVLDGDNLMQVVI